MGLFLGGVLVGTIAGVLIVSLVIVGADDSADIKAETCAKCLQRRRNMV